MAIAVAPTPNPNAMKFSTGVPVGGPGTYVKGAEAPEDFVASLLGLDGVMSVFLTADFVTISKAPDADWDAIVPSATAILESRFQG